MVTDRQLLAESTSFALAQLDLAQLAPEEVFGKELRRVRLRGKVANFKVSDRCNVLESQLVTLETETVDFSGCDFKDNSFSHCQFIDTKFVGTGFVLNTVSKTFFAGCNFYDTVVQNCEFYDVEFRECDFTSLVIKDCTFSNCRFVRCRTANKVFEMCLLNQCRFVETELQVQTVVENFGLRASEVETVLRSDRLDHPHEPADRPAVERLLESERRPLARLALFYYLNGDLTDGSEHLDAALEVGYWIRSQSTVGSFSIVLTRLCEFLMQLHERNELAYLPLLQLHTVTGALAMAVPPDTRMRQAEFAVYGVHLSVGRQIDGFIESLQRIKETRRRNWTFLVEGKHPRSFYRTELNEFFRRGRPRILSLRPHNSPWEMALSFGSTGGVAAFMALFLATRTRVELQRITTHAIVASTPRGCKRPRTRLAQITLGGAKLNEARSLMHLTAQISPTLAADIHLSISTRFVGKARKLMLNLLNK